ncbi:MAG: helix-turn-helix transcriptional regulator [Thermoplasmata archaeon]|nr:helix-turn-helix transcriptional regulator [Thermoplasmata archaeon]
MDDEDFIRTARVLSSDHGVRILRAFSDDEWKIATEISSHLDVHTSTASKYLVQLHKEGILERRTRKTGRRSTYEYHLRQPTILLELDLSGERELKAIECWDTCLSVFHRLISAGEESGFVDFTEEVDKLIPKLETETGIRNLSLFDPRCDIGVARLLVRKKLEAGQLGDGISGAKEASLVIFDAVKALCLKKIGSSATKKLFASVWSEFEHEDGRAIRELGLTGTFEGGFKNA